MIVFIESCVFFLGTLGAVLLIEAVGWMRRRCHRPPVHGRLEMFYEEGDGHFLSAKLPAAGLEQLLRDVNRGRFG